MQLSIQNLTKNFPNRTALDDVTLHIPEKSIVAVLGENGAGKSTLLRILGTVYAPDRGAVFFDGKELYRERLDQRQRLLFTPDHPLLFLDETVARNVASFAHIYERSIRGRETEIAEFMDHAGIAGHAWQPAASLSRGQLWKAAMTCVMAVQPELWLVDEPFASGMDVIGMNTFKRLARQLASAQSTVIYTTQMVEIAAEFADQICVLRDGKVVLWETSEVVRQMIARDQDQGESVLRGLK